jgi:hypothetical protein
VDVWLCSSWGISVLVHASDTPDAFRRYAELMRAEAANAGEGSQAAVRLRALAASPEHMTPAERTWVNEASEEQLREFVRALRSGCAPEDP